jgi:ABC-type transport system substrate-binding protein
MAWPRSPWTWPPSPDSPVTPMGTGPITYSPWPPDSHFTTTRNPHHWQAYLPCLDQVTFRPFADTTQRQDSLRTGSVDAMISLDPLIYQNFHSAPGYSYLEVLFFPAHLWLGR